MCLVLAVAGALLGFLRQENVGVRAGTERPMMLAPVWFFAALGLFLCARSSRPSIRTRLNVGLLFLVVSCLGIGIFRHWLPYAPSDVVRGVSPVTLFMLFYAVVVPEEPLRMAIAAVVCTLGDIAAMFLTVWALDNARPDRDRLSVQPAPSSHST